MGRRLEEEVTRLVKLLVARELMRRVGRRYCVVQANAFAAVSLSATVTALLAVTVLVGVEPWWQPRYLIPLLGMILGNSLTGISLGMDRCLGELADGRDRAEAALALNAPSSRQVPALQKSPGRPDSALRLVL